MFCTNCGADLSEGSIYCTNCGFKVVSEPELSYANTPENIATPNYNTFTEQENIASYPSEPATHTSNLEFNKSTDTIKAPTKSKVKLKTVILTVLLISIIAMSFFSYTSLFGFEGKWQCEDNTLSIAAQWMEKGTTLSFDSKKLTVKYNNGKTETGNYLYKDDKLEFTIGNSAVVSWNVDYSFSKMKLFVESPNTNTMHTVYFKRVITVKFWVYGGVLLALIIAFVITLLTKAKKSLYGVSAVGNTYDLSVNPLSTTPPPPKPVEDINIETATDSEFHEYINKELIDNTKSMPNGYNLDSDKNLIFDKPNREITVSQCVNSDKSFKNVDIVFSTDGILNNIAEEPLSFTPGYVAAKEDDPPITPTGFSAVPEEKPMSFEPKAEPVSEVIAQCKEDDAADEILTDNSPEAAETPEIPKAPDTPASPGPQKASSNPAFKSAGDL